MTVGAISPVLKVRSSLLLSHRVAAANSLLKWQGTEVRKVTATYRLVRVGLKP